MEFKRFLISAYSPYSQQGGALDFLMTVDEFPYKDMMNLVTASYDNGVEPFIQVFDTKTGKVNEQNFLDYEVLSKEDFIQKNLGLIQDLFAGEGYVWMNNMEEVISQNQKEFLGGIIDE